MSGNVQIPIPWKHSVESHIISRLCVFLRKLELIRKTKQSQSLSQVKYDTMGMPKERLLYSHTITFAKKLVGLGNPRNFQCGKLGP